MANKTYQARVQSKIDTSENWAKATNFVPLKGEICIYSDLHRMKVGDGTTKINDLDFEKSVWLGTETIANISSVNTSYYQGIISNPSTSLDDIQTAYDAGFDVKILVNSTLLFSLTIAPESGVCTFFYLDQNYIYTLQTSVNGTYIWTKTRFKELPDVSSQDNNKILKVVNGAWSTANLDKGVLVVNFELLASGDNQKYAQADKTPTDIASALNNGQIVAGVLDYNNVVHILILNNAVNGLVFSTTITSDNKIQTISLVYENNNTRYKIIDEVIESFTDTEIETFYTANA